MPSKSSLNRYSNLPCDVKIAEGTMVNGLRTETKDSYHSLFRPKSRLWVVTELYYPEDNQTGYYLTQIAEGLTKIFDVKVICGQPSYAARGTFAPKRETRNGVEIFRIWGTTFDKNVLLFRLLNMLTLGCSMFLKSLLNFHRSDEVLFVSAPPSLPFIAALAAKLCRTKYTFIIHDKYPEILIATGNAALGSTFVNILNRLNDWLYKNAKKIIVLGRDMQELVQSQLKNCSRREIPVTVIQSWAALEEVEPLPRQENPLLIELGISGKFVFLYAGNMGHAQDIESIVKCAEQLKDDERFHFLFIGSGIKRKWLETEVKEKKWNNVTILAPRPRSEQKIFLNACDVGLVTLVKKMSGAAIPSRTYNILATGKPILALIEEHSEVARLIEEEGVGWIVPPLEPESLLKTIYRLYSEREKIPEMGHRARKCALEKYSPAIAIEKYRSAFSELPSPYTEKIIVER